MSLGREVGLGQTDIVLDGDPAISSPKSGQGPQFSAHVYCGQTAGWIKMALGLEVGLSPGHIVLDGDPAPPPQKGHSPQFSARVYCGQTAGWIKMPRGTEIGLGPGDMEPSPPCRGTAPPIFGSCLLWPNGWMHHDTDATWYGRRLQPRRHCGRWGPSSPSPKGAQPPIFGPYTFWLNDWMD